LTLDTRAENRVRPGQNPGLRVLYDGIRKGRHMVVISPATRWGGRPYGLGPGDSFNFDPIEPAVGHTVTLHLSDHTFARLMRQRDLRARHRRPRGQR
jgi:hypothetical protein